MSQPVSYAYDVSGGGAGAGTTQQYDPAVYAAWQQYYAQLQQSMLQGVQSAAGVAQQQMPLYGQPQAQSGQQLPGGSVYGYFDQSVQAQANNQPAYSSGIDMAGGGGPGGWSQGAGLDHGSHVRIGFGGSGERGSFGVGGRGGGRGGFVSDRGGRGGGFVGGGFGAGARGRGDLGGKRPSRFDSGGQNRGGFDRRGPVGGRGRGGFDRGSFNGRARGGRGGIGGGGKENGKNIVFVAGLPHMADAQNVYHVFNALGEVECFPDGKPKIKFYDDHGVSKGECTITFRNEEIAQRVIDTYNGQLFPGSDKIMSISIAEFKLAGDGIGRGGRRGFGARGGVGGAEGFGRGGRGAVRGGFGGGGGDRGSRDGGFRSGRGGDRGGRGGGGRGGGFGGANRELRGSGLGRGRGGSRGGSGDRGAGVRGGGVGSNSEVRPNDWICECGNNNFSFRRECNSCKKPRPGGPGAGDRHRPY